MVLTLDAFYATAGRDCRTALLKSANFLDFFQNTLKNKDGLPPTIASML